jgi:hypothetical protein
MTTSLNTSPNSKPVMSDPTRHPLMFQASSMPLTSAFVNVSTPVPRNSGLLQIPKTKESNTRNYLVLAAFGIAILLMMLPKKTIKMNPQDAESIITSLLDSEKYFELVAFLDERKLASDIDIIIKHKKGKLPDWVLIKLFELKREYGK